MPSPNHTSDRHHAGFWTIRKNYLWRLGYHATNLVFAYLPFVYAWVALKGGAK